MAKTPVPLTEAQKAAKKAEAQKAKADSFTKLARKRMTNALKALDLVANLGNRASYVYTDEQVAKIDTALAAAVAKVKGAFAADAKVDAGGFDF